MAGIKKTARKGSRELALEYGILARTRVESLERSMLKNPKRAGPALGQARERLAAWGALESLISGGDGLWRKACAASAGDALLEAIGPEDRMEALESAAREMARRDCAAGIAWAKSRGASLEFPVETGGMGAGFGWARLCLRGGVAANALGEIERQGALEAEALEWSSGKWPGGRHPALEAIRWERVGEEGKAREALEILDRAGLGSSQSEGFRLGLLRQAAQDGGDLAWERWEREGIRAEELGAAGEEIFREAAWLALWRLADGSEEGGETRARRLLGSRMAEGILRGRSVADYLLEDLCRDTMSGNWGGQEWRFAALADVLGSRQGWAKSLGEIGEGTLRESLRTMAAALASLSASPGDPEDPAPPERRLMAELIRREASLEGAAKRRAPRKA